MLPRECVPQGALQLIVMQGMDIRNKTESKFLIKIIKY